MIPTFNHHVTGSAGGIASKSRKRDDSIRCTSRTLSSNKDVKLTVDGAWNRICSAGRPVGSILIFSRLPSPWPLREKNDDRDDVTAKKEASVWWCQKPKLKPAWLLLFGRAKKVMQSQNRLQYSFSIFCIFWGKLSKNFSM